MLVLVTGGAGYVGSHLVRRLLRAGHEVRVLDRLDYGGSSLLGECGSPAFSLHRGDVTDRALLHRAAEGVSAIVHLAARVGFPACQRDPQDAVRSNVEGTMAVLDELDAGQRLVFASTASVYGAGGAEHRDESCTVSPLSLYARTKVEAEELVRARGDGVILRFATGFGVSNRMRFDLLPNDLLRIVLRDGRLSLYEPDFRRCFIHVADMAGAVHHALDHWDLVAGETFNVSDTGLNMTKLELVGRIAQVADYQLDVVAGGHDSDERDYYLSSDKLGATGFRASSDMTEVLRGVMTAVQLLDGIGYGRQSEA